MNYFENSRTFKYLKKRFHQVSWKCELNHSKKNPITKKAIYKGIILIEKPIEEEINASDLLDSIAQVDAFFKENAVFTQNAKFFRNLVNHVNINLFSGPIHRIIQSTKHIFS